LTEEVMSFVCTLSANDSVLSRY